ncbi:MAG: hypothetical protein KBG04_07120 [Bacteroidales bacterium]|nr:hypothetical protein [Bacteroidales bacterium]
MIIKIGDKKYNIPSENVDPIKSKKGVYNVDCIHVYAYYGKNFYSKRKNIIEIPISNEEFDLGEAVKNFPFKHDNFYEKDIIGYALYYANKQWSKKLNVYKKIITISINQIGTEKTSQNNSIKNTINNKICIDHGYLPTYEDYENTRRKLLREKKNKITIDDFLNYMQKDIEQRGLTMCRDWRSLTEKNIELWSRNK